MKDAGSCTPHQISIHPHDDDDDDDDDDFSYLWLCLQLTGYCIKDILKSFSSVFPYAVFHWLM